MATASSKVIQRIDVHHKASNIDGISWSRDNRLAVVTNSFLTIISITGVHTDEKKKVSRLQIKRSAIAVDHKPEIKDVDVRFSLSRLEPLSVAPYHATAIIDPALSPKIMKQVGYEDVTCAKWSPVGCDRTGRSVLALLFRTNKLSLYIADKRSLHGWCEILDLSVKHVEEMEKGVYFKDKSSLKGELPADARRTLGEEKTWEKFTEWQRRKYLLNFTCIEWFPAIVSCLQQANNTMRKFAYLATMVKSGQLFIWQAHLPLVKNHSFMHRAVAGYTSMFYPSCLAWYGVSDEQASYLACGNTDGIIKVFLMKISSTNIGLPDISIVKAYSFCDEPDGITVDCIAWYRKDSKLYLACSKGPHVSLFHTQIIKDGALTKPSKQVITGIHLLNVTGLAISPSGMLYSASAEGSVQQFQIGSRVCSTAMDCEVLAGHGYNGVSICPNGVFMALYENQRTLFHYKKGATAVHGEVAIISLVPREENVQELISSASSLVDIVSIRNRFIYQELFKADISDAMSLPEDLRHFSQAYLQFLWNLLSSDPKFEKYKGRDSIEFSTNNTMPSEKSDELQSTCSFEMIEKQVATLAMEKVLKFFLNYHEGKQRLCNTPFSGDTTVKTICHWLVQRNPSESVTDLLRKVWSILCNSDISTSGTEQGTDGTYGSTDVRAEILASNNVSESCMCGHPIALKEVRFGRCQLGHVWPRCCVTFKLLDGTNARVCENCNAHALNRHPIDSPFEDWTKHLLDVTSSCTYCGAWFEEV